MNLSSPLVILHQSPALGDRYGYADFLTTSYKEISLEQARQIFSHKHSAGTQTIVCVNALKLITNLAIQPTPHLRLICLSTIKKLLARDHRQELKIPEFSFDLAPSQFLVWVKKILAAATAKIEARNLHSLVQLECQLIPVIIAMEQAGLPFDKNLWQSQLAIYRHEAVQTEQKLQEYLGISEGFALFENNSLDLNQSNIIKQRLEKILNIKLSGLSYDSLKHVDHEVIKLYLHNRECARMLSTYGDNFLGKISLDNRIRANFIALGSASGRIACQNPNLQALPKDPKFQSCIKTQNNNKLIYFDYGAFELRILAGLSQDSELIKIFHQGQDIHSLIASAVFGCSVSKQENANLRDQAKILNFGIIYGMGERALAQQLSMSEQQAAKLMAQYFKKFSRVKEFLLSLEDQAEKLGYAQTALGRRAYWEKSGDLRADKQTLGHLKRVARNMPIQGTGADIAKLAMIKAFKAIHEQALDACLVNMIHDELVFECRSELRGELSSLVKSAMSEAFRAILPQIEAEVNVES